MNRKAIELAISTLILIILGILVLIGLIYMVTNGFKAFRTNTDPLLDNTQISAIRQACQSSCDTQNRFSFCCTPYNVTRQQSMNCTDKRLDVPCSLDCTSFSCTA